MAEIIHSNPVRGRMRPEVARRRIEAFARRFGQAHLYFAQHAAFPLALTPDLAYSLWANFSQDIRGKKLGIPWIAVADLLLSSLCEEIGNELYEMNVVVREALLDDLQAHPDFGQQRLKDLSRFLLKQIERQLENHDSDVRDFARTQQWTALAYIDPDYAALELARALRASLYQQDLPEQLRLVSLIESFAEPLANPNFAPLLTYARYLERSLRGDIVSAQTYLSKLPITETSTEIQGIRLPIFQPVRTPKVVTLQQAANTSLDTHMKGKQEKKSEQEALSDILTYTPKPETPRVKPSILNEVEVLMTQDFDVAFRQLPAQKCEIVAQKIKFLTINPHHPSLLAHRLWRIHGQIWDCHIDHGHGGTHLLYEIRGKSLLLWHLGGHEIVDHAHLLSFNHSSQFLPWEHLRADAAPPSVLPEQDNGRKNVQSPLWGTPTPESADSEINYFAYFRDAHLRMLGVPEALVRSVKERETLAEVFQLPDLPAQSKEHLMDLVTSPSMQTVLFDSSQLLYRTRLDRLDGYFEGRIKKLMLNLEEEQQQYVKLDHVPLLLLKGTAGCGKTTIGIYRAIRLAEQGRRVLMVTFNSTLATVTKTLIEELVGPLPANLEVNTFHQIMGSLLNSRLNIPRGAQRSLPRQFLHEALLEVRKSQTAQVLTRDETFFQDEIQGVIKALDLVSVEAYKAIKRYGRKIALGPIQREAVWKVYQAYQRRMADAGIHEWADAALLVLHEIGDGPLEKVYDDIIVDEAQDLKPVDLRVIQKLVIPQGGTQLILGDAAQTLYSRGFSWIQAGISARGRTSILRINYRNTCQIAEAASQLILNNTLMRASNEYVDPQWTRREGRLPMLLCAQNSYQQIDQVHQEILRLIGAEVCRLSDIAILGYENETCRFYKDVLVSHGLRAFLHNDLDFDILEEQIKIMTVHSSKGLEFPVVFLMGLIEGEFPRPPRGDIHDEEEAQLEIERARMLCYVGMTRAADLLYLVTARGRESRFIHELAGKIEMCQQ